jgi:hypothetical protein
VPLDNGESDLAQRLLVLDRMTRLRGSVGPIQKLVEGLTADPQRLEQFRAEFEALAAPYHFDNVMHQDYLLTRARVA